MSFPLVALSVEEAVAALRRVGFRTRSEPGRIVLERENRVVTLPTTGLLEPADVRALLRDAGVDYVMLLDCLATPLPIPKDENANATNGGREMKKTILLVEDDIDARDIYGTTLRHLGYRVIEAPTVKDARDAVRAFVPDVVILDCRLPDGDGLQLVNAWRDGAMGRVPVIVISAHRERQDLDAALIAGADVFVPKPCPGNVLAAHVDVVMRAAAPTRRFRAPMVER